MSDYSIFIRNKDGYYTSRLQDIISVTITETLNEVGSWSIRSTTMENCPFKPGDGIVVYKNGAYYYSGIAKRITESYDGYKQTFTWTASGVNDLEYLNRRVVYPDPVDLSTDTVTHYTDSGTLAEVVKRLIDKNLGVDAALPRMDTLIGATQIDDPGDTVSVSLRYPVLFKAIKTLLDAQEYSIRAYFDANTRKINYQIYASQDLSGTMLFNTALGMGIISSSYSADVPIGNYIISAGEGEGVARSFAFASDADSISEWGRIEYYHDMRATDPADIQSDADSTMRNYAQMSIGYSADLLSSYAVDYRTNWNLGDYVSVVIRNEILVIRVLQVTTSITFDKESIKMTVGTVDKGAMMKIFDRLAELRSDVDQLQRINS